MNRAYMILATRPIWPFVESGLKAAGYNPLMKPPIMGQVEPGDLLVLWNRMRQEEIIAEQFEQQGGTVLVLENGYFGELESNLRVSPPYALAKHGHNGSGTWNIGKEPRFPKFGLELKPWKTDGEYVLVCPNRGIGSRKMKMPLDWAQKVVQKLQSLTNYPIKVRMHPGNWRKRPARVPLAADLAKARVVIIWSSSAGVQALAEGIPVIYCAPHWIGEQACTNRLELVDTPVMGDREATFERMAWAQWTVQEIQSGEPFEFLTNGH